MNPRDEQIAAIKQKVTRLREDRLAECYQHVFSGYESASVVDQIARVTPISDRTPSDDFHVLTNSEARRIDHFNDDSYYWDTYCSQLGRSVALGEERYFFEELKTVPGEGEPIHVEDPSFESLVVAVDLLRSRGYAPDTLCAPIGLFVPFGGDKGLNIDWNASPREVLIQSDARLKLYWSSGAAPLDRFVVLDSSRMRWRFKVDPDTGGRLTVAIGESVIGTGEHGVVFLAETVAKFDVNVEAAVAIALDGVPLDGDEYVRRRQLW